MIPEETMMTAKISDTPEIEDFLRLASGLEQDGGNPRTRKIAHRILSDLFKAIEDLNASEA
jgi:catechol 1,2-dioxygenase